MIFRSLECATSEFIAPSPFQNLADEARLYFLWPYEGQISKHGRTAKARWAIYDLQFRFMVLSSVNPTVKAKYVVSFFSSVLTEPSILVHINCNDILQDCFAVTGSMVKYMAR